MRFRSAYAVVLPVGLVTVAIYLVAVLVLSSVHFSKNENSLTKASSTTVASNVGTQTGAVLGCTAPVCAPTELITPSPLAQPPTLPACVTTTTYGNSTVIFNWNAGAGATTYTVDVSTVDLQANPNSTNYTRKVGITSTSTNGTNVTPIGQNWVNSGGSTLQSGGQLSLAPGTTYYWRVIGVNGTNFSAPAVGTSFSVPRCRADLMVILDPSTGLLQSDCVTPQTGAYSLGATLCRKVVVSNQSSGSGALTNSDVTIGVWPTGAAPLDLPSCPSAPAPAPLNVATNFSLSANTSQTINVTFDVGNINRTPTVVIYADTGCANSSKDVDTNGNSTYSNNSTSFTYSVGVPAWFDTTGGDVGAGSDNYSGRISVSSADKTISDYLLASATAETMSTSVRPSYWQIQSGVSSVPLPKLVPSGGIYNYFNQKFRSIAQAQPPSGFKTCNLGLKFISGYYRCSLNGTPDWNLTLNNAKNSTSGAVIFVDGNLTISGDALDPPSSTSSKVFLVKGDVNVDIGVTIVDGVYIVGGSFNTGTSGNCLTVNGAVYAKTVNLNRTATAVPSCGNSASSPAETFAYNPKYFFAMYSLIGISNTSWQEIAP